MVYFRHVKNYEDAIKETGRTLKKNGYFYLMDISQYFFGLPIFKLLFPPESYITKKECIRQLENCGFKVEKSRCRLLFFIAAKNVQK